MTKLELHGASNSELYQGGHSSSAGNLSLASNSSMDSNLSSSSSSNCSLPSHISSSSSIDSALIWFYTSCDYKNLPYKPLAAASCASGISSLCIADNNRLIAGTSSSGIQSIRISASAQSLELDQSQLGSSPFPSGSVKSLLPIQNRVLSSHQSGSITIWEQDQSKMRVSGALPTKLQTAANLLLPGSYVRVRRHRKTLWIKHADAVSCLAAMGSEFIFSVSWDRSLKMWRVSDMKCVQSIPSAHEDAINSVVVHDQFVYTAGACGKIKAWELSRTKKKTSLTRVAVLDRHKSSVNSLAVDPVTGHLYSASSDKSICVWEREDAAMHMSPVDCLRGHSMAVLSLGAPLNSVKSSRFLFCSGSADKTIRVWSRERFSGAHSCLSVLKGHLGPVRSLAIRHSEDEGSVQVFSGSLDCQVRAWSVSLDEGSGE